MKNKKGFTLIELLAVIVILGVIMVIAIPFVMGYIERSKKTSFEDTAYGIISSAQYYVTNLENGEEVIQSITCDYNNCGKLTFKGKVPSGVVNIYDDYTISLAITDGNYCAYKNGNETTVKVLEGKCTGVTVMQYAAGESEDETITNLQNQISSLQSQMDSKTASMQNEIDSLTTSLTSQATINTSLQNQINSSSSLIANTKNKFTFSTSAEQLTGDKWINGKPIYTKTIDFGALPNTTTKTVAHNVLNVDIMWVDMENSFIYYSSDNTSFPVIIADPNATAGAWYVRTTKTQLSITTGSNRTAYSAIVTVKYTKTTD
ncbi:MAG: type II secretion system protein [Bacilli bacterium]|nr:type II secretion system protein [Bacilli bacterium]